VADHEVPARARPHRNLQDKNWKFSAGDAKERGHWNAYMAAYEDTIRNTATKDAPWYAVPADNKVFTRLVVCAAVIETLARLDLAYPRVDKAKRAELAEARRMLGKG
jgi:polyphosphate kinase 2 (PPK2 family)